MSAAQYYTKTVFASYAIHFWLEVLGKLKKKINLTGSQTRDIPVYNIVLQPTTLQRALNTTIHRQENECRPNYNI
jgi:hypothetical protein